MKVRSTTASGSSGSGVYETQKAVDEYLQFHFDDEILPFSFGPKEALDFPARLAQICQKHSTSFQSALDVGCAVGGATFEMTRNFQHVLGIDFSAAFVTAAQQMAEKKEMAYSRLVEGEIYESGVAKLKEGTNPERTKFLVGDACNLGEIGSFDCVLAANLLCRLPNPSLFLNRLKDITNTNGIVVFVSPYSWLEEYTPKENWIGGYTKEDGTNNTRQKRIGSVATKEDGTNVFSGEKIKQILEEMNFKLVAENDIPFFIREHRRKFQWGCSHLTVWQKK